MTAPAKPRRYFTGRPCPQGHVCDRYTSTRACVMCAKEKTRLHSERKRRAAGVEPRKARMSAEERLERRRLGRLAAGAKPRPRTAEERRERRLASLARYAAKSPDKLAKAQADYRAANRDQWLASKKKWAHNNRESLRIKAHRRRARTSGPGLSKRIVQVLLVAQNGLCVACSSDIRETYQIDHIVALANGGEHCDANVQLLCPTCNRSKGAKDFEPWMKSRRNGPAAQGGSRQGRKTQTGRPHAIATG